MNARVIHAAPNIGADPSPAVTLHMTLDLTVEGPAPIQPLFIDSI